MMSKTLQFAYSLKRGSLGDSIIAIASVLAYEPLQYEQGDTSSLLIYQRVRASSENCAFKKVDTSRYSPKSYHEAIRPRREVVR